MKQGEKGERETDTEGLKDILYSLPINPPHNILEIFPPVCRRWCPSEVSPKKFSGYEKVFGIGQLCLPTLHHL